MQAALPASGRGWPGWLQGGSKRGTREAGSRWKAVATRERYESTTVQLWIPAHGRLYRSRSSGFLCVRRGRRCLDEYDLRFELRRHGDEQPLHVWSGGGHSGNSAGGGAGFSFCSGTRGLGQGTHDWRGFPCGIGGFDSFRFGDGAYESGTYGAILDARFSG